MQRCENETLLTPSRRKARGIKREGYTEKTTLSASRCEQGMRSSRQSTPFPPKKKHRPRELSPVESEKKADTKKSPLIGPPPETPKSELNFPNRHSPPERPADEVQPHLFPEWYTKGCVDMQYGFYRFRYGENLSQRYKIISKLGEGTFGMVLECWDRTEKRYVAMKIIRGIDKYRASAMLELEALNSIKVGDSDCTSHCVRLDKWFNYRGHVCLVFEKHGPSLYDFLKKNNYSPFDADLVRDIGRQILQAVAFVHDLQIIHTDLKPENILFQKDGSGLRIPCDSMITLIDFGSATFEHKHHGRIVSTRHYRAPEVVIGAKWSYGCDLWSVGCILIELITGETLFQTHEDIEHLAMMERVLGHMPASLARQCDEHSRKQFNSEYELDWPHGASSRKSLRAVRRLMEIRRWIEEVGHLSIRPYIDDFVDLLRQLMRFDPAERISAKEALEHRFFTTGNKQP